MHLLSGKAYPFRYVVGASGKVPQHLLWRGKYFHKLGVDRTGAHRFVENYVVQLYDDNMERK